LIRFARRLPSSERFFKKISSNEAITGGVRAVVLAA